MNGVHQAVIPGFTGKVSPEWLGRGGWLADTLRAATVPRFQHEVTAAQGNESLLAEFQSIAETGVFASLQSGDWFVAFGAPHHVGAEYEWIPIHAFGFLRKHPEHKNALVGGGITYWNVHIVEPARWLTHAGPTIEAVSEMPRISTPARVAFVTDYIANCRRRRLPATKSGLEAAWRQAGHRGSRAELNAELERVLGQTVPKRGRPAIIRNN